MNRKIKSLRLALAAVLAIAGLSAATTLAVGGITGTGSSSSTGTQSVGGGTVTKQSITDFTLSVSDGDKAESLPFLSSVIRNSNGTVNANHNVTVTLTRPDSSSTYFVQKTDNDGRLRGHITGDNLTQVGSYNLSAHVWSGKTASDTFSIREKLFKDLDDQVVTGRRQHFRNRTNDTNAFSIEDASGDSIFSVDTILKQITVADLKPKIAAGITPGITNTEIDNRSGGYGLGYFDDGMLIGPDGFARFFYYDAVDQGTNTGFHFIRCLNADCSQRNDSYTQTGVYDGTFSSDMAFGPDGFARISAAYYDDDLSSYQQSFIRCNDADCSAPVITHIDTDAGESHAGYYGSSIAIGADGFARMTYVRDDPDTLQFVRCLDADCATKITTELGMSSNNYETSSMVLGSDGLPRIVYQDYDTSSLNFIRCTNADCTSTVLTVLDDNTSGDSPGYYGMEMVMGSDGFPRIASIDDGSDYNLSYIKCADADCTTKTTEVVSATPGTNTGPELSLDDSGNAWLTYEDADGFLMVAHCTDASCSDHDTPISIDPVSYMADYINAMALGLDGLPRIAYTNGSDGVWFAQLGAEDGQDVYVGTNLGSGDARFNEVNALQLSANILTPLEDTLKIQGNTQFVGHAAIGPNAAINSGQLSEDGEEYYNLLNLQEKITDFSADNIEGITNFLRLQPTTDGGDVSGIHTLITNIGSDNHNLSSLRGVYNQVQYSGATVGTVASQTNLADISSTNASSVYGQENTVNLSGGSVFTAFGAQNSLNVNNVGLFNAYGSSFAVNVNNGSTSNVQGVLIDVGTTNATLSNVYGLQTNIHSQYPSGVITNSTGLSINTPNVQFGGQVTNNYGLRIEDQSSVGSSKSYNLYSDGANSKNYFAGKLGIGVLVPNYKLEVSGDVGFTGKLTVTDNVTFSGATLTLSSNMRGINIALGSGVTTKAITFGTAHSDANYLVDCTPTWNTTCWVTNKTTSGFTLNFGTATPDANQKVDWLVVR